MLRRSLQQRFEQLRLRLSEQVQTLPLGNDSWLDTERELLAVERALARMPSARADTSRDRRRIAGVTSSDAESGGCALPWLG